MATPLEVKKNLEKNIKESYVNSGGMKVVHCTIDIDSIGMLKINMALNPGSLPKEAVEELINKTFNSVGVKAFVKSSWNDIRIKHGTGVTRIEAEGYM